MLGTNQNLHQMKKILLSFVMLFAMTAVMAQSVNRKMVVVEIGTGTWCTYCPGAAMGADDLLENGCFVAVVENHNGDAYANNYSNARNSYYAITGYPTAAFDGLLKVVGGNHTTSMFPQYLPKYNQRIAIPSNIDMSMAVSNTGLDYTVVVTMTKVGNLTATNMVLQFCLTQSNIMVNWQGQTHLEHVNRLMVPDQSGTPVDFTSGDVQTVTLNFSLTAGVTLEDLEFVTFVQNNTGKEILQGIKRGVIDLETGFDASQTQVVKDGVVTFSNSTFGGYIGVPETYEWIFPGANPGFSTDANPVVTYTDCGEHDVTLIVNRGGQMDTLVKTAYINVGPIINIAATPGDTVCDNASITLDATTPNAISYFWIPGNFTTPSITIDTMGIGAGLHTYTVTVGLPDCPATKSKTIFFDNCTGIADRTQGITTSVYPNPSNGTFTVEIEAAKISNAVLKVVNSLGVTVYQENNLQVNQKLVKNISLKNISSGIYFLVLQNGDDKTVQKIFVK